MEPPVSFHPESLLTHLVCAVWLTAGLRLLTASAQNDSRPDFLFGLGLLFGGLLAGWTNAPIVEHGTWPAETLLLSAAVLWCFAVGTADEATGLEPGDRWPPATALAAFAVLLHLVTKEVGPPPTVEFGVPWQPTELLAVLAAGFAWLRTRRLSREIFGTLGSRRARELLWCVLGSGLAGLLDEPIARCVSLGLLLLGPASFLIHEAFVARTLLARHAAVALAMVLGCATSDMLARSATRDDHLDRTVQVATSLALAQPRLQSPIEAAAKGSIREEHLALYQRRLQEVAQQFATLRTHVDALGSAALQSSAEQLAEALLAHGRHARAAFDAVATRKSAWGDDAARTRAAEELDDCLAECRLALERGTAAVQNLAQAAVAELESQAAPADRARELLMALVIAIGLLGLALLTPSLAAAPGPSRSTERAFVLDVTDFDPRAWLASLLSSARAPAEQKGLLLLQQVAPDVPERLETDARLLREAVRALLAESIARTRRGHISVSLELDLRQLVLHVQDTGSGLSREEMRDALQPDGDDAQPAAGLARAARIAHELGGRLLLSSQLGAGTSATLRVPVGITAPLAPV